MRSIFCGLIFLVVFVSCSKDSAYIPFSPKIVKVQNNYELANGDKVKVNIEGKNMKNLDLNSVWRTVEHPILNGKNNIIYHNVFKP